ncbi:MAG: hypothetical protein NTY42_11080 [Planctomycetota bacterium]|nr:hypothetical protein [Planctomycetota bacterium]
MTRKYYGASNSLTQSVLFSKRRSPLSMYGILQSSPIAQDITSVSVIASKGPVKHINSLGRKRIARDCVAISSPDGLQGRFASIESQR